MNWSIAITKHYPVIIFVLLLFTVHHVKAKDDIPIPLTSSENEVGFYDLLSKQEEVYQLGIAHKEQSGYVIQLTNKADSNFTLQAITQKIGTYLDFNPSYYYNRQYALIDKFIDYAQYHNLAIHEFFTEGNHFILIRNGMLILWPDNIAQHKN